MSRKKLITLFIWVVLVICVIGCAVREINWQVREVKAAKMEQFIKEITFAGSETEELAAVDRLATWINSEGIKMSLNAFDRTTGQRTSLSEAIENSNEDIVFELGVYTSACGSIPDRFYLVVLKKPSNIAVLTYKMRLLVAGRMSIPAATAREKSWNNSTSTR